MPILNDSSTQIDGAGAATIELDARLADEFLHATPLVVVPDTSVAVAQRRSDLSIAAQAAAKRAIDVAIATTVLLVSLPLVALISLAIVLDSRGGIFYRAERVGLNGRRLRMLKFRKMRHDAAGNPLTMSEDQRFTRIGRFLARAKLDELPQLWHVLRGEMSLIGPRPEDPGFVEERRDDYAEILRVRPGVTGLSQLAFAEESSILCDVDPMTHYRSRIFPQKIKLDRMYAADPSLGMDLRIIFWTVAAVLLRRDVAVHRGTGKMNLRRR